MYMYQYSRLPFVLQHMACPCPPPPQADSPLGTVDLYDCNRITKSSGKKGFGLDVEVGASLSAWVKF